MLVEKQKCLSRDSVSAGKREAMRKIAGNRASREECGILACLLAMLWDLFNSYAGGQGLTGWLSTYGKALWSGNREEATFALNQGGPRLRAPLKA